MIDPINEPISDIAHEIAAIYWPLGYTSAQEVLFDEQLEKVEKLLRDAFLEQHVSECEVCRIERGEQIYCNMAREIMEKK